MTIDAQEIIQLCGSPAYVYDLDIVRERARALKKAMHYQPTQLLYAIKANANPAVVRVLLEEGYGIDAVSPGEVAMALALGCPAEKIQYTENNMTNAEMQDATDNGVMITCGSLDRLERLAKSGAKTAAVRFNPDVGGGAHEKVVTGGPLTKFGVHHSQVAEAVKLTEGTDCKIVGAHMHIGSGILDANLFVSAMGVILDIAKQLPDLEFIDFGGGIGIPYKPTDEAVDVPALGDHASQLMEKFSEAYGRPIEMRLEPGRFLVGDAGSLYCSVTSVKRNPDGRCFVGCDSGFNHLVRPCMYNSYHHIDNCSNPDGDIETVDIVGNICESGDIFARDRELPTAKVGDILAIRDAGAYGIVMASTYNIRPLPAEAVIQDGKLSLQRAARSINDLLADYGI